MAKSKKKAPVVKNDNEDRSITVDYEKKDIRTDLTTLLADRDQATLNELVELRERLTKGNK